MPGRNFLYIPGPTNVPQRVRNAMSVEQEDMRAADFPEFTLPLFEDMKKMFKTQTGRVFIYPASGTGGWEAAVSNTLSAGDKVLMSHFGHFSYLWVDLCQRHGLDVQALEIDWGEGVPIEQYADILKADTNREIKAVFATHNETATGVASDIAAVRKALDDADHPALLFVDGVSSIASLDFRMDEWGVDLCVSGSQKGFMLPTGLGIVCVSQKALEAGRQHKSFLRTAGPSMSPFNAWVFLKGLETLGLRMREHCRNAQQVAEWLTQQNGVTKVFYPGLQDHPQHALAKAQQSGFGGIVSFEVEGGRKAAWQFIDGTKLFSITANLGDAKSTISRY